MADERQIFVYKGVEYNLPSSYTPEQAKARILQHLGEKPSQPTTETKSVEQPTKRQTTWKEDLAIPATEAMITAGKGAGLFASSLADVIGANEWADNLRTKVNKGAEYWRKRSNPDNAEQSTAAKVGGVVGTLPAQFLAMPFQAARTGMEWLDEGESLRRAQAATIVDTAANALGAAIPMKGQGIVPGLSSLIGGAGNVATNLAGSEVKKRLAETEGGKKLSSYSEEEGARDFAVGALLGLIPGGKAASNTKVKRVKDLKEAAKAADVAQAADAAQKQNIPEQLELPLETSAQTIAEQQARQGGQMDLFAPVNQQLMGRVPDVSLEAPRAPIPNEAQGTLPFNDSPETIAATQRAGDPQMDMFAGERPSAEAYNPEVAKQQALLAEQMKRAQQEHLDFNDFGNNDPMERMPEMRYDKFQNEQRVTPFNPNVDENGMPIRADLSMELQNLENPLQRNLWGDELGPALDQERSLTEAIDSMPPGPERDRAIQMLSQDVNSGMQLPANPNSGTGRASMRVPNSQRGAIDFKELGLGVSNLVNKQRDAFNKVTRNGFVGEERVAGDVPTQDILASARSAKDSGSWNSVEAGATSRAYKNRAPWVRDTWELMLNSLKRAEINVRNYVTGFDGFERSVRGLSKQEQYELAQIVKEDMFYREQTSPELLKEAGFTTKQLDALAKMRKMHEASLAAINYGRQVQGKPPITSQEAYLTSAWDGEVKMRITDAEGKTVYYLAANSERGVKKQFEALKKEFPEYKAGPVERVKQTYNGRDVDSAYSIMADAIGRDNPEFQKIQEWYTALQSTEAYNAMGTKRHFEPKGNIRGFVGDRPGMDPFKEATALLQKQATFAKESFHWAALQDGSKKMAPIFQDQYIRDNHKNNLAYLQEQLRIAAGANEGAFSRGVNDGIRAAGFTPSQVFGAATQAKAWFMFQKLGFNLGYGAANLAQLPYTAPHLADIAHKVGAFNPLRSVGVASILALPMASAHYGKQLAGIDLSSMGGKENFYRDMFQYAEQNGVTSRSIVDEAPIDAGIVGRAANFTTSTPEALIRSFAFTLYADALKQTGKMSDMDVFKEAERRTNMSLGDFRETERAPIFSRLGNVGNILNTLQTYGINYYQQANYFLRETAKGNPAPLVLFAATQMGLAGLSGMPVAQDLEKGWELIKGMLPNSLWAKVGDFDPRIWAYEHFGRTSVDGLLSTVTNVSMNSRVGAPDAASMLQAPGGPLVDAASQVAAVGKLALNPTDPVQQAETAMKVAPVGLGGLLENTAFRDQTGIDTKQGRNVYKTTDLHKRDTGYIRNAEEDNLRNYNFRSPKEVAERNANWKVGSYKAELSKRKPSFADDFYDAVLQGDKARAAKIDSNYTKLYGKSINDADMQKRINEQYLSDYQRIMARADKATPAELLRIVKVKKLVEEYSK